MKVLNFSCLEKLPMLLDPKQIDFQTIRPAWNDPIKCFWCDSLVPLKEVKEHHKKTHPRLETRSYDFNEKPPRFKVKEKVELFWNQRSKKEWFCSVCGNRHIQDIEDSKNFFNHVKCLDAYQFNKHLGIAEITEVFKIEMHKYQVTDDNEPLRDKYAVDCKSLIANDLFDGKILAKRDGFKSTESFFQYFDSNYDLSSPKPFYVYRGKRIK